MARQGILVVVFILLTVVLLLLTGCQTTQTNACSKPVLDIAIHNGDKSKAEFCLISMQNKLTPEEVKNYREMLSLM